MPKSEHVQFVEKLVAAANSGDPDAWAALYSPDVSNHGRAGGRDGMGRIFRALDQVFPDWHFDVSEVIAEGDNIVVLMTMSGTHLGTSALPVLGGALVGVPPTGRSVKVEHIHRYQVVDGLVHDHRAVRDDLGMMQQLGLIESPEAAADISRPQR